MDSLQATEAASAAVAKSPDTRVKLADIEAAIAATFYVNGKDAGMAAFAQSDWAGDVVVPRVLDALAPLTVCIVVMRNGFSVVGKAAPADPVNFDKALGRQYAREDAIRQLWPLLAFSMKDVFHKYTLGNASVAADGDEATEEFLAKLAASGVRKDAKY